MHTLSKKMLVTFVIVTLLGAFLRFGYAVFPNPVTALLAPTNESVWEHLKILFWPYLFGALVLTRGGEAGTRAPWLLTALILCAGMLLSGYLYRVLMGGNALLVDVILYVLWMAAGFLLPGLLRSITDRPGVGGCVALAAAALCGMLVLFTFLPPDHVLFVDLSGVNTFATIPY